MPKQNKELGKGWELETKQQRTKQMKQVLCQSANSAFEQREQDLSPLSLSCQLIHTMKMEDGLRIAHSVRQPVGFAQGLEMHISLRHRAP